MHAYEVNTHTSKQDDNEGHGEVRDVDPATASSMLDQGAVILDVREDDEWAAGHIEGSTPAPLGDLDPATISAEGPVVAVCRSGNRSSKAAQRLAEAGHEVVNLAGGVQEWHQQGLGL